MKGFAKASDSRVQAEVGPRLSKGGLFSLVTVEIPPSVLSGVLFTRYFDFHDLNLRTTLQSVPYSHEQVAELRFTVALEHTHGRGLRGKNQHHSPVCLAICQGMATHLTGGQAARKRHCRLARVITVTWQSQYVNTGHTWSPLLPCLTAPLFFLIKAIV